MFRLLARGDVCTAISLPLQEAGEQSSSAAKVLGVYYENCILHDRVATIFVGRFQGRTSDLPQGSKLICI